MTWTFRKHPEPGPRPIGYWIDDETGAPIADVYDMPNGSADPDSRARLIAKAPELANVLRELLYAWDDESKTVLEIKLESPMNDARALLAEIEGEV